MNNRAFGVVILRIGRAALMAIVSAGVAIADEAADSKTRDSEELRETARLIQADLPRWKLRMGSKATELKLNPKPILRWTNPATGRMHGEIYVWTARGRPEVVLSLYKVWE